MDPEWPRSRFRVLVSGGIQKEDWRPLWAALAMLEILEGPLEVLVHPLPGVSRQAAAIAQRQGHHLTVLEAGAPGRWWPEQQAIDFVLLYSGRAPDERLRELESRARLLTHGHHHLRERAGLEDLVKSRVWARFPTIFDLLNTAEPRPPLSLAELVEAVRTKNPKWILPLVEEIFRVRHVQKRNTTGRQAG